MEINKIYNENCLITMAKMPDNFIDLTVTSPPYDNLRNYKGYDFQFEEIAKELFRVTKQGGVVVWVVGDATIDGSETGSSFRQALYFMDLGFNLHDTMIYAKNGPAYPAKNKYYAVFEFMFVFSKGAPKHFNPLKDRPNRWAGEKWSNKRTRRNKEGILKDEAWSPDQGGKFGVRFNIWEFNVGHGYQSSDEIAYKHPAIFPERLASDHIESWSNEGDLIYDPMGGSGTTIKMAYLLNRNFVMSEISSEYCLIAESRLHDSQRQNRLCFPPAAVSKVL
jgi:site-specific DNA-methyltransferase (adenine-specific)